VIPETQAVADLDVRVVGVCKRYGDVAAVDGVSLEVKRGEFFTLLGPSGSGKTTTLRLIAGFERPDDGHVELGGVDVTGRAPYARDVNTVFQDYALFLGLWTIVVGHATFCVVIVYNNLLARLRRVPGSLTEASMDLGANGWQTMRFVTFPAISTALISGALLAFALSFDEVIVTTFTAGANNTLPLWILGNIRLRQQLPEVNVVVLIVLALTIVPVVIAQRLTHESGILRTEQ